MKNKIFILLSVCLCAAITTYAQVVYDFKSENKDGIELAYKILDDGESVALTYNTHPNTSTPFSVSNYEYIATDTLFIPEVVKYNEKQYPVTGLYELALSGTPEINCIYLPKTIQNICYGLRLNQQLGLLPAFAMANTHSIDVDKENDVFCSISGILYTKDLKELVAYPCANPDDTVFIEEGVEIIPGFTLVTPNAKFIELPLSLKKIGLWNFDTPLVEQIILKDSVEVLEESCIFSTGLKHLTLGSNLKEVEPFFVYTDSILQIYCRAQQPPAIKHRYQTNNPRFLYERLLDSDSGFLYVPRKSIPLYREAEGWSQFKNIYPIEPPIVSGVNEAEVSWVQNFSATGYVWTLYLDEAQTQPYLQLTFDKDGHLTNIDLNRPNAPQLPAEEGDKQEDKRYAEYYSFTITGLDANTKYYYTRQTLAGDRVIDEEVGSFETLPDGAPTGVNPLLFEPSPQKTFENGMLRIRKNGNTYNVNGTKVE